MIKNILIIDLETTGLSPKTAKIIEIGAILYNVEHREILQNFSSLLPCASNEAEHINKIRPGLTRCEYPKSNILPILDRMLICADAIVAHNAHFDKGFIAETPLANTFLRKKWICTKNSFNWPVLLNRTRLQDICEAMNVRYDGAHRSLPDCNFIAQCFSKIADLSERINQ